MAKRFIGGISKQNANQNVHNERTGKYVRQRKRTAANKVERIEKEIAYLQERLSHWRSQKY